MDVDVDVMVDADATAPLPMEAMHMLRCMAPKKASGVSTPQLVDFTAHVILTKSVAVPPG